MPSHFVSTHPNWTSGCQEIAVDMIFLVRQSCIGIRNCRFLCCHVPIYQHLMTPVHQHHWLRLPYQLLTPPLHHSLVLLQCCYRNSTQRRNWGDSKAQEGRCGKPVHIFWTLHIATLFISCYYIHVIVSCVMSVSCSCLWVVLPHAIFSRKSFHVSWFGLLYIIQWQIQGDFQGFWKL